MAVPRTIMWAYPWDLSDEEVEPALRAIAQTAKVEAVSLAVAYHVSTYFLPHNPRRAVYFGEDGRVFFQPETGRYEATQLRPKVSEVVEGPNYLPSLVSRMRDHGLGFTAWVVYNYNHHLARTFPECAKVDALGNRYLNQLCPANPHVRAYQVALTGDVAANYRPDYIFVESPGYLAYNYGWSNPKVQAAVAPRDGFLLGLCFCEHCVSAASESGVAAARLKERVAEHLRASLLALPGINPPPADREWQHSAFDGELAGFLAVREQVAADAYEAIAAECRRHGVKVFGSVPLAESGDGDAGRVAALLDRGLASVPAAGASTDAVRRRKAALRPGADLLAHGHPGSHPSQTDFVARMLACRDAGADGFGCYNYGLVRPEHLRWVGAVVEAWQRG
ncbi:MAG: hypothetical protein HY332_17805 [Chloroflexi bacterium]|nr:hypothetical protein [Chloroflexota bacterium]